MNHETTEQKAAREAAEATAAFAGGLANIVGMMEPLFETAEGIKADMARRGYSPTAAEQIATEFISHSMNLMYGSALHDMRKGGAS